MDAIKNGVFLWKTKKKIIETIQKKNNLLYIKDRDAKTVAYQYKDYKKLYTKYKTMIDSIVVQLSRQKFKHFIMNRYL